MAEGEVPPAVSYGSSGAELALPDIALVAVKLLGLYALLSCIPYLAYVPLPWRQVPDGSSRWEVLSFAISGVCYVAAGIFLLIGSRWVVTRVMGVRGGVVPPVPVTEHVQAM